VCELSEDRLARIRYIICRTEYPCADGWGSAAVYEDIAEELLLDRDRLAEENRVLRDRLASMGTIEEDENVRIE